MHSDTQSSLIKEATSPGSNNDLFLVAPLSPTLTCFLPSLKCKFTLCVVHLESGRLKEKTRTSQSLEVSVGALLEELLTAVYSCLCLWLIWVISLCVSFLYQVQNFIQSQVSACCWCVLDLRATILQICIKRKKSTSAQVLPDVFLQLFAAQLRYE